MVQALEGIRVVDFTQGMAGCLATMILADYGAEVIRVEPDGGDPLWSHPAYLLWNRGKKSIELDPRSSEVDSQLTKLIGGADVLVESLRPGEADRLGFGYEKASSINPGLVYVSISAFGQEGPYRDLKAYDGIVNAKSGRMRDQVGHFINRPIYRAVNDTSYHTAMFVVQGTLAALRVVWMTGQGQRLDTSLLRGVTAPNNPWRRFEGQALPPDIYPGQSGGADVLRGELVPDRREIDPLTAIPSQLCTECKDGRWIMHSHIQRDLFKGWIKAIGFEWIWDDPRYKGAPTSFPSDGDRIELNRMILARMKEKTSQEWIEVYVANPDAVGEVMETTQEALRHPQFVHNGHRIEIDDPRVGPMIQVGPFVAMSETPAVIRTPAPFPGQHTAEVLAAAPVLRTPVSSGREVPKRPLEGILMLELASWLASPFAGALLADLGARVIKVEPLTGDPYRHMPTNENMIRAMQGKESLAVDLKTAEGRQILHQLVAKADVLMHNYRPGVPERLHIDYQTLRAIKPDLVYLYAASYGSSGPHSMRAAFNPTMGALAGNSVFQSGEGNRPIGDQSPDPIAGSGVATGIMLGLAARLHTGKGQYLETTMMNSVVYCNSDDAFDYSAKPLRHNPDNLQLGLEATYRLYETKDGWVFLGATRDEEFRALCSAAGRPELSSETRFCTASERYSHRRELGGVLEAVFKSRTADEWEALLTAVDVGCVRADGMGHRRFLHEDPHTQAVNFMVPTRHRFFSSSAPEGRYWRHGPVVSFSLTPCEEGRPYVVLGEHTREVMEELGYSDAEISRLKEAGVIDWDKESAEEQSVRASSRAQ
jgi:crotonobetainyl-CoA:carnitine CoA-transferase CaiB-like acyl-CoA transferase